MTAILALASALIIGSSDFGAGLATRRAPALTITLWAQATSLVVVGAALLVFGWETVTTTDIVAGGVAGLSGAFSFAAFYAALGRGTMSRVAPVTALVGAGLPVAFGALTGDAISAIGWIGLFLGLISIVLVTRGDGLETGLGFSREAMLLALAAGCGFAIFFIVLAETESAAGAWPLAVARAVSVPVVALACRATSTEVRLDASAGKLAMLAGVGDMVANLLLLEALRLGPLAVAGVFGSLYPISTVMLAWFVLGERLGRAQFAGIALALAALPLVGLD